MLTELIQSGMHKDTAIEALQLVNSLWELKEHSLRYPNFRISPQISPLLHA